MSWTKTVINTIILLTGFFFTALMLQLTIPYLGMRYDVSFLLSKQDVLHVSAWRTSFYLHITSSLPVLLLGFMQVNRNLLQSKPGWHRVLGKFYVAIVLLVSAPSGFVMALYANGGLIAKSSFTMIALLWWYFTWRAYQKARRGELQEHKKNMYRSFALTLSAITLRTYILLIPQFVHLRGDYLYMLVSWLSWVPNLIVAEILIARFRNQPLVS